jgi:hypothetical protein
MKALSKWLIPFVLCASLSAAQDIPNFSPYAMRRFAATPATAAPDFGSPAFRLGEFRARPTMDSFQWQPLAPAAQQRSHSTQMLKTLQRNRLIATVAGSVPAIARMFDEDAPSARRVSVSPLIDIDDGRIGVRVTLRLGQ